MSSRSRHVNIHVDLLKMVKARSETGYSATISVLKYNVSDAGTMYQINLLAYNANGESEIVTMTARTDGKGEGEDVFFSSSDTDKYRSITISVMY